jgi:hypothetical protein
LAALEREAVLRPTLGCLLVHVGRFLDLALGLGEDRAGREEAKLMAGKS